MSTAGGDRALVLATAGRFWGGDEVSEVWIDRGPSRRPQDQQWHILRSPARARLIVPVRPVWAHAMLARHDSSPRARAARAALAIGMSGPMASMIPTWRLHSDADRGDRIEAVLGEMAGCTVGVGVRLGTPRPNRKPLLQAMDECGRTVSWTKVGDTPGNRARVDREFRALSDLHGRLATVDVPAPRGFIDRAGMPMLVMSPLPAGLRPWRWAPIPWDEMSEVAFAAGTVAGPVAEAPLWDQWRSAAPKIEPELADRLGAVIDQTLMRCGDVEVRLGSWHGDWTPWNMGRHNRRLQLWDWENYTHGIAIGSDALHYAAQRLFARRAAPEEVRDVLAELEPGLAGMGVTGRAVEATWLMYLLEVARRYAVAGAADSRSSQRLSWVVATLEQAVGSSAGRWRVS